jgi:rRNA maturation RNase YbeY
LAVFFSFSGDQKKIKFSSKFKLLVKEIVYAEGKKLGEIQFVFVVPGEILRVNNAFLKHNYFTDVITFDHGQRDMVSGDIFICPDVVIENAVMYNVSDRNELYRVMIHGVLHLLGYEDKTDELRREMRERENLYLSLGVEKEYLKADDK